MKAKQSDTVNLLIALLISTIILGMWQYFVEIPRKKLQNEAMKQETHRVVKVNKENEKKAAAVPTLSRTEWLGQSPRLKIVSDHLHGSLSLKGLRIDDLTLARYRETQAPDSKEVVLLSPVYAKEGYFAEIGWLGQDASLTLPDKNTVWTASGEALTPGTPVTLTWQNPQGVTFTADLSLDNNYMFTVTQTATRDGAKLPMQTYAYVNRLYNPGEHMPINILHEGPLGVFDGQLKEVPYSDLKDAKEMSFSSQKKGWLGISDKYWFTAIITPDAPFHARIYSYFADDGRERYQADYSSVTPRESNTIQLFTGAKELSLLDGYAKAKDIPLFDRAVDFGMLYFLTKPIFLTLTFFHSLVGNFGVAILLLTILVKLLMFPLANASYRSANQMKALMPKMQELQERYKDDMVRLNQERMELYKREKVNPAAGCLPALIQLPVFFALYKVLYVTLEMRHAPFFGWIQDLSAPDPTNVFTLFGLLMWSPPAILHLGIWPILMCASMVIQQSMSPQPADPTQAKVLKYMPYFFLFMFSGVAAGLVIYWTWSNVLSILQQWAIKHIHTDDRKAKPA